MTTAYLPTIMNIAEICARLGVEDAILSPGSRCAPLVIAFSRQPKIQARSVNDERAAGFIALGIAQQKQKPVVLVCTSGTAALNYSPAIAESYYQNIPLIVMTADRPPEWIAQQDGQTINQLGIYQNYVKASYALPADNSHPDAVWQIERSIAEAIHLATAPAYAPVHLNVPFREPFYPQPQQVITFDSKLKVIQQLNSQAVLSDETWQSLITALQAAKRILIVAGQQFLTKEQLQVLNQLNITVVGDIISNLHGLENVIAHSDMFLASIDESTKQQLQPDLLISFGQSVISKNLKLYLRAYPATEHWHLQVAGQVADTYQSLTQIIRLNPEDFFAQLNLTGFKNLSGLAYHQLWQTLEEKSQNLLKTFFDQQEFNEFLAVKTIIDCLPEPCLLHLGNSMPIRYANFVGLNQKQITVYANRGTSGIDGSMSTAVGHSLASEVLNVLIIGDMSFFYDRNALWHSSIPKNLRIVLLNNQGGGIFDILPEPKQLPELSEFFITPHQLTAENTAKDFGLSYLSCRTQPQLLAALAEFFTVSEKAKLLEIHTEIASNSLIFKQFKQQWKTSYAN
jgi:2-succinyl-5-enolpyruvyl-6-hydroxy-3-cyclohexene-1-carboxylate synthase